MKLSPRSTTLTPSQRTAGTGRVVLTAGLLIVVEALWRGSAARIVMAMAILALGASLLVFAKRAA